MIENRSTAPYAGQDAWRSHHVQKRVVRTHHGHRHRTSRSATPKQRDFLSEDGEDALEIRANGEIVGPRFLGSE